MGRDVFTFEMTAVSAIVLSTMLIMGPFISCFSFLGSCNNNFHDFKLVNVLHCLLFN